MMNNTTTIYGIFDDEEILLSSVKEIRSNDINIKEVYSPFPIHGLDPLLGLKETRLGIASFIYGCIGLLFAALLINYIMIWNWPMNIGGKVLEYNRNNVKKNPIVPKKIPISTNVGEYIVHEDGR